MRVDQLAESKIVDEAMDQHAQWIAIAFAQWLRDNTLADGAPKLLSLKDKRRYTIDQLYRIFIQDISK
jgi:hypothetical protein